jgi:hypothetical protein
VPLRLGPERDAAIAGHRRAGVAPRPARLLGVDAAHPACRCVSPPGRPHRSAGRGLMHRPW